MIARQYECLLLFFSAQKIHMSPFTYAAIEDKSAYIIKERGDLEIKVGHVTRAGPCRASAPRGARAYALARRHARRAGRHLDT